MLYGIFTKPIHVEKLVNFLTQHTYLDFIISTQKSEVYREFDIGVSYCFPYIIKYPLEDKRPWFNYHPAPLPEYPGIYNYSSAIENKVTNYGVTLHRITEKVDSGEIIKQNRFHLSSVPVDSNELGCITHYYLFQLFKETIEGLGKL